MKIKSLLIGMLASTAFVACTNDESPVNNEQAVVGKESYLAVNLKTTNIASRATTGFEDGTVDENAVSKVLFFFFDAEKNPYLVDGTNSFKEEAIKMNAEASKNSIEEISDKIVLIEESKNIPPQYILAVLNAPAELKKNMSLAELNREVGAYNQTESGFVMTNSVYKHAATGEVVVATELTADNLGASETEALDNPVDIYVERVAAKVRVNTENNAELFSTNQNTAKGTPVFAKIKGWNVTNVKSEANLLKKIDVAWTDDALGFTGWNDAPNFRSYWANTSNTAAPTHPNNWNNLDNIVTASDYYYEHTDATNKAQLLVAVEFVKEDGSALEDVIAEWYGARYTKTDLTKAIANSVKAKVYIKNGNTASSITPDYITFKQEVETATSKRYLSYATLAKDAPEGQSFVDADGKTLSKDEVTAILEGIRPAKIWEKGGYYFFNIDHLGNAEGLVRNHLYDIIVNGISGLGTPVYDPEKKITPETPEDDSSYIAAQVNILAWKVVNQSVTLGGDTPAAETPAE